MKTTEDDNKKELVPKKNKKAVILCCFGVIIAFILGALAFINFKTTLFVTYQVCSA